MSRSSPSFLPLPLPGEALYSLVARYHSLSAQADGVTTKRLLGTPTLSPTLPRSLDRLVEAVEGRWGTLEQIIERHTAYPYFAHFLTPSRAQHVIERMRTLPGARPRRVVGFQGGRIAPVRNVRMCPVCVNTQMRDHGAAYWVTAQQLPAVVVCHEHHADLIDACPRCGPFAHYQSALRLPHASCPWCGHTHTATYRLREHARFGDDAIDFAQMTHDLLHGALRPLSIDTRIRLYRAKAANLGAPAKQVVRWLESRASRYRPDLLRQLGVLKDGAITLPMSIMHDSKGIVHPALHLLVIDIIFGSIATYRDDAAKFVAEMQRQAEVDLLKTLSSHAYDLVAASAAASRSPQSLVDELIEGGVDVAQTFRNTDARRENLISSALNAGIATDKIATFAGVRVEAIYVRQRTHAATSGRRKERFATQRQQRRAIFEAMRKSSTPLASLQMSGHSYDKLFSWLKTHDSKWLSEILLRTKKVTQSRRRSGLRSLLGELTKRRALFKAMRVSGTNVTSATAEGHSYAALFSWLSKHDAEWFSRTIRETEVLRATRRVDVRRQQYRSACAVLTNAAEPTEAMRSRRRKLRSRLLSEDATWLAAFEGSSKGETERVWTLIRDERRAAFKSMRESDSTLAPKQPAERTYRALTEWLQRHDPEWFADAMKGPGRVAARIRRSIPERRAQFEALRRSAGPLRSGAPGCRYPTLYNWLKRHDSEWLDSVMSQSQGRRKPRRSKT